MWRLPPHHMPRRDLVQGLRGAGVVTIEAPSGFGKSTLAAELAADPVGGRRALEVCLTADAAGSEGLLRQLRRALREVGERTAEAALQRSAHDPAARLDGMLDELREAPPLAIVVDDAHHLGADAGLLVTLVDRRPPSVSFIITARALPSAAHALRTSAEAAQVTATDLRFDVADAQRLFSDGFELELDDRTVARLVASTGGWPAALALAGSRMRRLGAVVEMSSPDLAASVLAVIPPDLADLARQMAHLPWIDAAMARTVSGRSHVLERLLDAGLPLAVDGDGRYRLPGSFADALTGGAALDAEFAAAVARAHLDAGRADEALEVLRRARAWSDVAATLLELTPRARAVLAADDVVRAVDALPASTVRAHPAVLVEQARALAILGAREQVGAVLDRAERIAVAQPPAFARAIDVQRAADVLYAGDADQAQRRAEQILGAADDGEDRTVARALTVVGTAHAWAARWPEATRALCRATELFVGLGEPHQAAGALLQFGFAVQLHEDLHAAERTFDRAVELASGEARIRATALTYLGEVRAWLGRRKEAEADLGEAFDLARAVGDARAQAYASWGLALVASLEGDTARTIAHAQAGERNLSEWIDTVVGLTFLAGAADVLDRAGATAEADEMLARAVARRDELPDMVGLAELAITARRGDPDGVEGMWAAIADDDGIEPFERLRCRVLRAYAALRRGDPVVAELYAEAVAEAEALGLAQYPANMEGAAWAALQAWAVSRGGAWEIRCLGPLEVTRGGAAVPVPPGRPAALLGLLAAMGRPQRLPWVIDALWPDLPEREGRRRLRQVLYRLRDSGLDVVERVGDDQIALRRDVGTDLAEFERHATRRSDDSAELAVRQVRGPLLDGDELIGRHPDVEALRERMHVRRRLLLERLVEAASAAGDRRRAIEWATALHRGDEADEAAALRLARLLVEDGRGDEARAVTSATIAALARLDLDPSPAVTQAAHARIVG